MNPDIVGHLGDPAGRGQQGTAWKSRSEGCNRDFLALRRWRRGCTAGTSGSAVGLCCHLFLRCCKNEGGGLFIAGPRIHFEVKWTTMVDESTLNLTVILHGTTQTRCIILPKATDNALITLNNISWPFFRSFTIVSLQCCPESTARITTPIRGENKT